MQEAQLFESALRAAVRTEPDPRLGAILVPRLAEAARASTVEAETHAVRRGPRTQRRPRSRRALVARVGIAVALVPLVLAGLAFAGVTVPQPARSVFNAVGITLPNQPATQTENQAGSSEQTGTTGNGVTTQTEQSATVPSKGKSEAAHRHALEQHQKARGKALGHERGKAIGLNGATPPGQSGQTGPPAHSNAGGSSGSHSSHAAPKLTPKPHPTPLPHGNANGHSK